MKLNFIKKAITIFLLSATALSVGVVGVSAEYVAQEPYVGILCEYNPNARGTSAPKASDEVNLSNNPYILSGEFRKMAYTDKCFRPDGNGKLSYNISIFYQDIDLSDGGWNMQKQLTVGIYRLEDDKVVHYKVRNAPYYEGSTSTYEDYVNVSATVSGLDPLELYYIIVKKTDDGLYADIVGTVSHP